MSGFTLKFANEEQYKEFINTVKQDVLSEMNETQTIKQDNNWDKFIRKFREERRREAISGKWEYVACRNEFYGMFKTAFNRRTVWHLNSVDIEELESFGSELMELINKYRYKTIDGETNGSSNDN